MSKSYSLADFPYLKLWEHKEKSESEQDSHLKYVLSLSCLSTKRFSILNIYFQQKLIKKMAIVSLSSYYEYIKESLLIESNHFFK